MIKKLTFSVLTVLAAVTLFCSCKGKSQEEEYLIPYSSVAPALDQLLYSPVWEAVVPVKPFHAPWDGLDDETEFRCFATDSLFLFRFIVKDTTLALTGDFKGERDVEPDDSAVVLISHDGKLDT